MESRYGATFRKEPGRCPICSAALLQDFVCYMKHLAVEHKVVMAFVERDLEAAQSCPDDVLTDDLRAEVFSQHDVVQQEFLRQLLLGAQPLGGLLGRQAGRGEYGEALVGLVKLIVEEDEEQREEQINLQLGGHVPRH